MEGSIWMVKDELKLFPPRVVNWTCSDQQKFQYPDKQENSNTDHLHIQFSCISTNDGLALSKIRE
jgi:hypothetical protein